MHAEKQPNAASPKRRPSRRVFAKATPVVVRRAVSPIPFSVGNRFLRDRHDLALNFQGQPWPQSG